MKLQDLRRKCVTTIVSAAPCAGQTPSRRAKPRPLRAAARFAGLSILLLVPSFWQPRIQAGDLSSHLYNAWLAQLIARGQAPGLSLAAQSSNVLFDWILSGLMRACGPPAAERIAVSIAVLVFFWGAFAFVWSNSRARRAPWQMVPCLALLAYGWVYHMGLFNFYLSLGLCFGALALCARGKAGALAAIPLFGTAYLGHALPVAWALSVLLYAHAARVAGPRRRIPLAIAALAAQAVAGAVLGVCFETRRDPDQFMAMTGADQAWIYGRHYIAVAVALLAAWSLCFRRVLDARGAERTVLDVRFQLCALTSVAAVLLPGGVLLPGLHAGLDFLAQRMSLAVAVLFCALVASVRLPKALVAGMAGIALVFFGFLYADERALNRVETRIERAAAALPPGRRVVGALADPKSRINPFTHMVDRICVGRCFSYANYEPSTAGFRVRAANGNAFVVSNFGDSLHMQLGGYVVQPRDLPLYRIGLCQPGSPRICAAPLRAGETLRNADPRAAPGGL